MWKIETEEERQIVKNTLEAARLRMQGMADILKEIKKDLEKAKDLDDNGR